MNEKAVKMGKEGSIHMYEEDGLLHFVVDPAKEVGPSASGKTMLIASSAGNAKINIGSEATGDREAFLGLNLYYK